MLAVTIFLQIALAGIAMYLLWDNYILRDERPSLLDEVWEVRGQLRQANLDREAYLQRLEKVERELQIAEAQLETTLRMIEHITDVFGRGGKN